MRDEPPHEPTDENEPDGAEVNDGDGEPEADPVEYAAYRERRAESERRGAGGRKLLSGEEFARLAHEYERLIARMDPDDIQLDEWKRAEELRFLLLIEEEEE